MKIIVCLDKSSGMLFNNRRQSRDRVLIENVIELVGDSKIWCNSYTSKLFEDATQVFVSDTFIQDAGEDDYCFIENMVSLKV